jgi:thioredoxin-related protein
MISRRHMLAGSAAAIAFRPAPSRAEAILTDDGLYRQKWFLDSLLELSDDLNSATAGKKRFAVLWELRGCPYCKQMHEVNFGKPEIEAFIRDRFDILQLNIIGAREVTDFDGEKLSEKRLAAKYGIRGTPTVQFFPDQSAAVAGKKPAEREVARLHGYVEPGPFLATFRYVAQRAYEKGSLRDFLKANS